MSVTLSTKSSKFGSRYLVDKLSEGDEIGTLVVRALLYITAEIGDCGPGVPLERQNIEGCKKL